MTHHYPLKLKHCDRCSQTYYSRSHRSRWCSSACQTRHWRETNTLTKEQLEQEYLLQESERTNQQILETQEPLPTSN